MLTKVLSPKLNFYPGLIGFNSPSKKLFGADIPNIVENYLLSYH